MKRMLAIVLLLALLLCGCAGSGGSVEYNIGKSKQFSRSDIRAAMDEVVNYCRLKNASFDLLALDYEEDEFYTRMAEREAENYKADEAIVILADIHTHPDSVGSLEPDQTYGGYRWILTRNGIGRWQVQTGGFG